MQRFVQLEIVGEAVKRPCAGLRDVLIYNYMGVEVEAVWQITQDHVPTLKATVASIVGDSSFPDAS